MDSSAKVTYINALSRCLPKLHSYITKKSFNDKACFYGEDIKIFIEYIQTVDNKLYDTSGTDVPLYVTQGVYSPLRDFKNWASWLFHYCHLIICLEQLHPTSSSAGRNLRISDFGDYNVYRNVTKRNQCGYYLDEQQAYDEYIKAKNKVFKLVEDKYVNNWHKFETFILHTISVINMNVHTINTLGAFIDYTTSAHLIHDFHLDMFLNIKLFPYDFEVFFWTRF